MIAPVLQLFQLREVHAQAFLAVFAAELHLDKLGTPLHLAFEDDALAEEGVTDAIAGVELLLLRLLCLL